jgi:ABC-type multidrug transport system ATPase subunit
MIRCRQLSVSTGDKPLLHPVSLKFAKGTLSAIIGPSGCGKSTFMRALMNSNPGANRSGHSYFDDLEIQSPEDLQGRVGYVPQFSVAHRELTVSESIHYTKRLFTGSRNVTELLQMVGLEAHAHTRVGRLSGGQLRRLSLAMELSSNPHYLLCDEVTSGLDSESESEIIGLLRELASKHSITVLCVIHNLSALEQFDHIVVFKEGSLYFAGAYSQLMSSFQVDNSSELFSRLKQFGPQHQKEAVDRPLPPSTNPADQTRPSAKFLRQLFILYVRRFKLLSRDHSYLYLLLAMTVGFPLLVVIFAWNGLPAFEGLSLISDSNLVGQFQDELRFKEEAFQTGSLVSGLILFQVILVTLMGANNGSREIAGERTILEKEKLSGLNLAAYTSSKLIFLFGLSLFQGVWMALFVKHICGFPGAGIQQCALFVMVSFSMSLTALAFSSLCNSVEKSNLLSTYLVGLQLPLSGIVLALPSFAPLVLRPFIATFWGWSGYMHTIMESRFYDAVQMANTCPVFTLSTCMMVLLLHGIIAGGVVYWGVSQAKFTH